jgi:DNA-binding MarR family transcriptional regulator
MKSACLRKKENSLKKGGWAFLSNHGLVLLYIAGHPQSSTQEIAFKTDLSVSGVQKIITNLEAGGYISRARVGRSNHYTIHQEMPMRHPLESKYAVGDLLKALGYTFPKEIN